jgi:hypothetical protein
MKKSRYTKKQIIGKLKQHEVGVKTSDLFLELRGIRGIPAALLFSYWNCGSILSVRS